MSIDHLDISLIPLPFEDKLCNLNGTARPSSLNTIISNAFERLSRKTEGIWGHNGAYSYKICQLNEEKLLKKIFQEALEEQKEFNIMDIGAGNFEWGASRAEEIDALNHQFDGIKVNIFNLRGEKNPSLERFETKRCRIYNLGSFKIEDITQQLHERKFFLESEVDLIVSAMTLCHLADPAGTFVQILNLLRPKRGLLLMDGFFFTYENESCNDLNYEPNRNMFQLMLDTKAPFLVSPIHAKQRSLNHFVLQRMQEAPYQIPMKYRAVETAKLWRNNASYIVTQFTRESLKENNVGHGHEMDCVYGDKNLYEFFSSNHLFCTHMKWNSLTKNKSP